MPRLERFFPILGWGASYSGRTLVNDLIVASIVTVMLIPQSLAYAMLAGLSPEVGLYASIAPLLIYAVFGTSRTLAVGPVAVVSLMTATAVGAVASQGTPEYLGAAIALALLSGLLLMLMSVLRLGFLSNFLSHPVIAGFITASGLQIAASQVGPLLGIKASGETFVHVVRSVWVSLGDINAFTAMIGLVSLTFMLWAKRGLGPLLRKCGLGESPASTAAKCGPAVAIAAATALVWGLDLESRGVSIVGEVPEGLPKLALPSLDLDLWSVLIVPALLLSIVGYVESISVAFTLAARRRQRVDPDQELLALGASNVGAAISGGFPVTGGFSRTVVNFDAGAETPAAGAFTAAGIAMATLFLTPLLYFLPAAALSATIVVAVLTLVDLSSLSRVWACSRPDFAAMLATILVTLVGGIEPGLLTGVGLSLGLHLYRTSRPHIAVIGQIPGTAHFRNVQHYQVVTHPEIVSLRVDESLYFPNARYLEDQINAAVAENPGVRHLILVCSAVNTIDASALESLEAINQRLEEGGITFHLSAVKGPVMAILKRSRLLEELGGRVHLTQLDAVASINPELAERTLAAPRVS